MAQQLGELAVRPMRPGLHRSQRDPEFVGDVGVCHALEVLHANDDGLFGGKRLDCASHVPDGIEASHIGRQADHGGIVYPNVFEGVGFATGLVPVDVDCGSLRDRREPWCGVAPNVDAIRCLPRSHEGLLDRVFRQICTPEYTMRYRVHEASVLAIQRSHCLGLATLEALEDGSFHKGQRYDGYPARRRCRAGYPRALTDCR
jgi:hypothetical protein